MTKRELIEALERSDAPDDTLIILSSDEEGNSYREASLDATLSKCYPEDERGYEWQVLHPDDVGEYEEDGTELTDCLVVW
jgi:hypothetical protein